MPHATRVLTVALVCEYARRVRRATSRDVIGVGASRTVITTTCSRRER
jgi:hypothetical protein